jgi:hypothetical protein
MAIPATTKVSRSMVENNPLNAARNALATLADIKKVYLIGLK